MRFNGVRGRARAHGVLDGFGGAPRRSCSWRHRPTETFAEKFTRRVCLDERTHRPSARRNEKHRIALAIRCSCRGPRAVRFTYSWVGSESRSSVAARQALLPVVQVGSVFSLARFRARANSPVLVALVLVALVLVALVLVALVLVALVLVALVLVALVLVALVLVALDDPIVHFILSCNRRPISKGSHTPLSVSAR
jgi:hypothetical protein